MKNILEQSNLILLKEIDLLIASFQNKKDIAQELIPFYEKVSKACLQLRNEIQQSINDLRKSHENILEEILSDTQRHTREFYLYNYRLAIPIRRYLPSDRLCLKILHWLHSVHNRTKKIPCGFCDGDVGIWPEPTYPVIYFMPSSAQYGLLYLPLFFHEFGHLLYACHQPELDDLVKELQAAITDLLKPVVQYDNLQVQQDAKNKRIIVETWYIWIQELFCDAVGFQIGGLCFANAFSMYLKMLGRDRFVLSFEKLAYSPHPITWLRVHLLSTLLEKFELTKYANKLENEWKTIAEALSIREDYYGFYLDKFLDPVLETIDDMLTEAEPYQFGNHEITDFNLNPQEMSPVQLLNAAWSKFYENPETYLDWGKQATFNFLA